MFNCLPCGFRNQVQNSGLLLDVSFVRFKSCLFDSKLKSPLRKTVLTRQYFEIYTKLVHICLMRGKSNQNAELVAES